VTTRVLLVGWFSFLEGEATAGDVLSMEAVRAALSCAGVEHEVAWSAVMCPPGDVRLDEVAPPRYTHLLFVCGPVHGQPVRELHARFAGCHRIAVGVSVIDPADPAVTGFHEVIARDAPGRLPLPDLAAGQTPSTVPVVGVVLTEGQQEYGGRRRHEQVNASLRAWLRDRGEALLPLDTRLDPRDWRLGSTPAQLESIVRRLDAIVTTRLHGLVLALKNGLPALAIDPVAGGGKMAAQAAAWRWPAVVGADSLDRRTLDRRLGWCLSAPARRMAEDCRTRVRSTDSALIRDTLRLLGTRR
jgi:polysaccharide pyruvyl transferase